MTLSRGYGHPGSRSGRARRSRRRQREEPSRAGRRGDERAEGREGRHLVPEGQALQARLCWLSGCPGWARCCQVPPQHMPRLSSRPPHSHDLGTDGSAHPCLLFCQHSPGKILPLLLLVNVPDRLDMHEFLFLPTCDYNLLGRDLMAKMGMSIMTVKADEEATALVTLCQMSEKTYAEEKPEVRAVPQKCGKVDMQPLQMTSKPPGRVVSKKQYPVSRERRQGLTACC